MKDNFKLSKAGWVLKKLYPQLTHAAEGLVFTPAAGFVV